VNSEQGKKCIKHKGSKIWNLLPINLKKNIYLKSLFKKKLKELFLQFFEWNEGGFWRLFIMYSREKEIYGYRDYITIVLLCIGLVMFVLISIFVNNVQGWPARWTKALSGNPPLIFR